MAENYGWLPQIDMRAMTLLGQGLANRQQNNQMGNALGALGPDASLEDMARVLLQSNPQLGLKTMIEARQAQALEGYRANQAANAAQNARNLDLEIWDAYRGGNLPTFGTQPPGMEPMRVGPDGNPEMPALLEDKLLSIKEKKYREGAGTNQAKAEANEALKADSSKNLTNTLKVFYDNMTGFDDATLENSIGPWQGDTTSLWGYNPRAIAAQNYGALRNAIPGLGGEGSTYEVRGEIESATAALASAIKPFAKVGGEGTWTNFDQQKLESIVGELAKSRDRDEFNRRFKRAIARINATWDLSIDPQSVFGGGKDTSRFTGESEGPPMDMAVDPIEGSAAGVNENTMVGGTNIGRTEAQPPKATSPQIEGLKRELRKYRPGSPEAIAVIENFDRLIGKPGSAEFYLLRSR